MNKRQIIAELRRSACEHDTPWSCENEAFLVVMNDYLLDDESMLRRGHDGLRTLYLLVACALEDEL